jgi:hypothetical protein
MALHSQIGEEARLDRADLAFIAAVEGPLLDSLGAQQSGLDQDPHMFAQGRLADAELFGDEKRADAILDQIAVGLRREMGARVLQPVEDLETALVGERSDDNRRLHFVSLLSY